MSTIKFKKLILTDFMSYKEEIINLDRTGFISVKGKNENPLDMARSNGSGKSTLFNALNWVFTGKTISGAKSVENIYVENPKTIVEVEFEKNGTPYVVKRKKSPSKIYLYENDKDISGKGLRDTEKLLKEYFPELTEEVLSSVIILGQGLPKKFMSNSPSGRKEILEKLSDSEYLIQDLKTKLTSRKNDLSVSIRTKEDELLKLESELEFNHNSKESIMNELESMSSEDISVIDTQIQNETKNLTELENKVDELKHKISELDVEKEEKEKILNSIRDDYLFNRENLELQDTSTLNDNIQCTENNINVLSSKLNDIKNIVDVCPTCGQKIPNTVKPDTTELEEELSASLSTLEYYNNELKKLEDLNNEIVDKFDLEYNDTIKTNTDELNIIKKKLDELNTELKSMEDNVYNSLLFINEFKSKKELIDLKLKELNTSLSEVIEKIKTLSEQTVVELANKKLLDERLSINSNLLSLLNKEFRNILLDDIINFISERIKVYCSKIFNHEKLLFFVDKNNIVIEFDGKDYDVLSGGEKQKIDVIVQFAIRDMLCAYLDFSCNILVLDEITDNLDIVGTQQLFNLLSTSLNDVSSVYIISHHEDFDIPMDDEILIIKGEDKISRITG